MEVASRFFVYMNRWNKSILFNGKKTDTENIAKLIQETHIFAHIVYIIFYLKISDASVKTNEQKRSTRIEHDWS